MTSHRRTTTPYRKTTKGWAPRADPPTDPLDPRNLRILDAIFHEAALDACERPDEPDDEFAIRAISAFVADLTRRP